MLSKLIRHARANTVAYIALVVALGGGTTAYAAAKFTGADIVDESVTGADIQNGSLSAADTSIAAAFASNNADNPLPHVAEVLASANVTLARRSTLVVLGHSNGLVVCGEPAPESTLCQVNVGLYLDGNPIPASAGESAGLFPSDGKSFEELTLFATVTNVAAGAHAVSIAVGTADGDSVLVGFQGERVAAIAIPD